MVKITLAVRDFKQGVNRVFVLSGTRKGSWCDVPLMKVNKNDIICKYNVSCWKTTVCFLWYTGVGLRLRLSNVKLKSANSESYAANVTRKVSQSWVGNIHKSSFCLNKELLMHSIIVYLILIFIFTLLCEYRGLKSSVNLKRLITPQERVVRIFYQEYTKSFFCELTNCKLWIYYQTKYLYKKR